MPELPEVHTTSTYLKEVLPGLSIDGVWSRYDSPYYAGKQNIKDRAYFKKFKKEIVGKTVQDVERKGKHVLIRLSERTTILVHMKMTGHLLYGTYRRTHAKEKKETFEEWVALDDGPLFSDPFNRFIHFVITLSNGRHLALSDMRKFATIFAYPTHSPPQELQELGPDPLDKHFTFETLIKQLPVNSQRTIKHVLLDQRFVAGIGNIYSDEILWHADIHPQSIVGVIPRHALYDMYNSMKLILRRGIDLRGDSTSDYRRPDGAEGEYHYHHMVYQRTKETCSRRGCKGVIQKRVVGGRSAHFCDQHQIFYAPRTNI